MYPDHASLPIEEIERILQNNVKKGPITSIPSGSTLNSMGE